MATVVGFRGQVNDAAGGFDEVEEYCDACERETVHTVVVTVAELSTDEEKAVEYSREPRRVSQCVDCGATTTEWLTRKG